MYYIDNIFFFLVLFDFEGNELIIALIKKGGKEKRRAEEEIVYFLECTARRH